MGSNFGVTSAGVLYANGGYFSGNISSSSIDGGTITGGTISIGYNADTKKYNFTVTSGGILTTKGAILEDLTVKTTCKLLGKIHITDQTTAIMPTNAQMMVSGHTIIRGKLLINGSASYASAFATTNSGYQLEVHGKTYLNNDIYIDTENGPRRIRAFGANADDTTTLYFGKFGSAVDDGIGIGFNGNKCFMYTEQIWLGKSSTSVTYVNGNVQINGTGKFSIGKTLSTLDEGVTFYLGSATGVYIGDGDKVVLLSDYVKKAGGFTLFGESNYVTTYATMLFNGAANNGKGATYSVGSSA
jgi:hypothetical protein